MTDNFEADVRKAVRISVITAQATTTTWLVHPSFDSKGNVLATIDRAIGAVSVIAPASDKYCALVAMRDAVAKLNRSKVGAVDAVQQRVNRVDNASL